MADRRAEARRRRILENPSKRLERLENLSRRLDDFSTSENSHGGVVNSIDSPKQQSGGHDENRSTEINDQEKIIVNNGLCESGDMNDTPCESGDMNDIPCESGDMDDIPCESGDINDIPYEEYSDTNGYLPADGVSIEDMEEKPSWIRRKYRLLLFALLAWSIYMVVVKEFHFVLALVIGKRLPNDALPILIPTAFIAVEVQVIIVSIFLPKLNEEKSPAMLTLALSLCGIPRNVLNFIGKVTSLFILVLTDLAVYIFVIVFLKTLDENI